LLYLLAIQQGAGTMRRCKSERTARLALCVLAGLGTIAVAQDGAERSSPIPSELLTCQSVSGASRTRQACGEAEQSVLRLEREVTIVQELAAPNSLLCETSIVVEYFHRDTIARVNGMIENETCAASSGQYDVEVRVKDENGEMRTLQFREFWQRDDDLPVEFSADYPIGENVELIRLSTSGLKCTCADSLDQ
jgi:hypothetical protein